MLKVVIQFAIFVIVSSSAWTMRTPLSPVQNLSEPLGAKQNNYDLEALLYREEILRYEENRIFFLIEPYIETRMRMG